MTLSRDIRDLRLVKTREGYQEMAPEETGPQFSLLAAEFADAATREIEQARATLEARGVSFAADTLDTSVCHMAFFADPDGNALMLHHRYAPRVPEG